VHVVLAGVDAVLRVKSNMDSGMFLGLQHAAETASGGIRSKAS